MLSLLTLSVVCSLSFFDLSSVYFLPHSFPALPAYFFSKVRILTGSIPLSLSVLTSEENNQQPEGEEGEDASSPGTS